VHRSDLARLARHFYAPREHLSSSKRLNLKRWNLAQKRRVSAGCTDKKARFLACKRNSRLAYASRCTSCSVRYRRKLSRACISQPVGLVCLALGSRPGTREDLDRQNDSKRPVELIILFSPTWPPHRDSCQLHRQKGAIVCLRRGCQVHHLQDVGGSHPMPASQTQRFLGAKSN
jgi:hypothetical protein